MKMKKIIAMLLAVMMLVSMLAGCTGGNPADPSGTNGTSGTEGTGGPSNLDTFTYQSYSTALGTNWNPHTWEMNADSAVLGYIETPLADITVKDSETGEYQWIFVAATDIQDVTKDHQDDLTKYAVNLPEGADPSSITADYVYEIKLRPEMCWQDGTPINADTYIYSMQQLLDPAMKNYRANNYYTGSSAVAGAFGYFNQGAPIYDVVVPAYGEGEEPDYSLDLTQYDVYVNLDSEGMTIANYSFYTICDKYGYIDKDTYNAVAKDENMYGYVPVTDANKEAVLTMMDQYLSAFGMSIYNEDGSVVDELYREFLYYDTKEVSPAVSFDTVGVYKVDDYTIRYVCETAYSYYYFLTSCTSNWIVHKDLYESCKTTDEATGLVTSNYGTSLATTMSYGPYKMTVLEDNKQMVFEKNEKYWEYTVNADGSITSETFFEVDGEKQPQYQTDKVVINVMTDDAAKLAFLSGELDDWTVSADDAVKYATSEQLYQVDETYTLRLFFNTNLDSLKKMDAEGGNTNSVALSNYNFRKAMSLAIDRSEYVTSTAGYKAAYSLINSLYFYDVYEDPSSVYRNTEEAMQAICNLYGVPYGEGTPYATLEDAYKSINGYNLTEAKALMKTACDELVKAGLYKAGDPIVIRMGWAKGSMSAADHQLVTLLNKYMNAAAEGSGFGTITLEALDNLNNRYADVASGTYAIGYGAWGGAAFYPFGMFQVYCDPDYADIHEAGCWDPTKETLTLTFTDDDGNEVTDTLTWQVWSQCMEGTGKYANASNKVKLQILAGIEENYLKLYYCIPLCTTTVCSMLSYKLSYYTENYSIMYGFGGMRLMSYNYTDAEWAEYVASMNGNLGY